MDDPFYSEESCCHGQGETRRGFLEKLAGSAAGLAALGLAAAGEANAESRAEKSAEPLPAIALGPHRVTRLIIGGNPIYGYSHFNQLYSQHLSDYHSPERVLELLRACEAAGINTWQNSHASRTVEDVERCRAAGVRFHWLLLGKPDWDSHPKVIEEAAKRKPIGIAPHGLLAERLHRDGKLDALKDLLKRIRAAGTLVGLSTHNPALLKRAEEEAWDVDYYMCCLYYLTRPREEFARMLGEAPVGEIYLPSDRERMLEAVRSVKKSCLVYKVLAAGRLNLSTAGIRQTFQETLSAIKPIDAMIVGMFQEFGDQVWMNARLVRELLKEAAK
ncbi:MAG: hypothetical protein HY717_10825 [Planctomycetes bacterium]|nr:hypothetical protein [Planctomycetota bacterium]